MTQTSKEYAVALFSLAVESSSEKEISEGLAFVLDVFEKTPELEAFLDSPAIPKQTKLDTIHTAIDPYVAEYVASFVALLCEHRNIELLRECVNEYEALYSNSRRVSDALVTSAVELTEGERERLRMELEKRTHRTVRMQYQIDASLLGGVVVEVDGLILDGSLKRRLKTMKGVMEDGQKAGGDQ